MRKRTGMRIKPEGQATGGGEDGPPMTSQQRAQAGK